MRYDTQLGTEWKLLMTRYVFEYREDKYSSRDTKFLVTRENYVLAEYAKYAQYGQYAQ